jgi:hypothetical protein
MKICRLHLGCSFCSSTPSTTVHSGTTGFTFWKRAQARETRRDAVLSTLKRIHANRVDLANSRFVMTGSQVRVLFAAP